MMFVKDRKSVILLENGDTEVKKEIKLQGFSKNFLLRGLGHQIVGNWIRFILRKDKKHTLSNDFK
jgi:hypothetical protein